MSIFYLLIIALGLSVDSFAVAIGCGIKRKKIKIAQIVKISLIFGVIQGLMPVFGYFAGIGMASFIEGIDHFVAFFLLLAIGLKMIFESENKHDCKEKSSSIKITQVCMMGIATGIDAMAVGLGFGFLKDTDILGMAMIIGLVTAIITSLGLIIGKKVGHFFENKIQIFGGFVLILIGVKILIEHLT